MNVTLLDGWSWTLSHTDCFKCMFFDLLVYPYFHSKAKTVHLLQVVRSPLLFDLI
jgi:hypothetical protein